MNNLHTRGSHGEKKIAITVSPSLLARLDSVVAEGGDPSRSQAVEAAIEEKLRRLDRTRLARECAKLDPEFEKALAEEGMGLEREEWPEY
ncbi:MAG: ribbon-helix-helix domain-containing protein [Bacteroidota bacterium]|jgi:Arc/MetJ-type ribon-helix-helix transcriptional regulator|nr:ribbon-helix-helix domain-containing protein [Bacteroidota bacterium]